MFELPDQILMLWAPRSECGLVRYWVTDDPGYEVDLGFDFIAVFVSAFEDVENSL